MLCQGVDKSFSCARTDSAQDSSVCCINVTPQKCYNITQDKPRNTNEKRRLRRVASHTGVNRLKIYGPSRVFSSSIDHPDILDSCANVRFKLLSYSAITSVLSQGSRLLPTPAKYGVSCIESYVFMLLIPLLCFCLRHAPQWRQIQLAQNYRRTTCIAHTGLLPLPLHWLDIGPHSPCLQRQAMQ